MHTSTRDQPGHRPPHAQKPLMRVPFEPGVSRLALDVGGVISLVDTDAARGDAAASVAARAPTRECVAAVRALVGLFGAEHVFILSKCGSRMQQATVTFLLAPLGGDDGDGGGGASANFFDATGLLPGNVVFCTQRSGGVGRAVNFAPLRAPEPHIFPALDAAALAARWERGLSRAARARPRVADGDVGKGVVAAKLALTHLVDDRDDCLRSFLCEGHLEAAHDGLVVKPRQV